MKNIGFIAAGFCIMAGSFSIVRMIMNAVSYLRMGDSLPLFWLISSAVLGTAFIMLGIFIGMLARKLK